MLFKDYKIEDLLPLFISFPIIPPYNQGLQVDVKGNEFCEVAQMVNRNPHDATASWGFPLLLPSWQERRWCFRGPA